MWPLAHPMGVESMGDQGSLALTPTLSRKREREIGSPHPLAQYLVPSPAERERVRVRVR